LFRRKQNEQYSATPTKGTLEDEGKAGKETAFMSDVWQEV
jgi:hypothetical protein